MSIFDARGALNAVAEWNEARAARNLAYDAYVSARDKNWKALVRMARAHKAAFEAVGPDDAGLISWCDALYGDRDAILANIGPQS
jgi:hypothetical protein